MSIITDNTDFEHNPNWRLQAGAGRDGEGGFDPHDVVPLSDLTFNGNADIYRFQYNNMKIGDYIEIKLFGIDTNPGFAGLMFDYTCASEPPKNGSIVPIIQPLLLQD